MECQDILENIDCMSLSLSLMWLCGLFFPISSSLVGDSQGTFMVIRGLPEVDQILGLWEPSVVLSVAGVPAAGVVFSSLLSFFPDWGFLVFQWYWLAGAFCLQKSTFCRRRCCRELFRLSKVGRKFLFRLFSLR